MALERAANFGSAELLHPEGMHRIPFAFGDLAVPHHGVLLLAEIGSLAFARSPSYFVPLLHSVSEFACWASTVATRVYPWITPLLVAVFSLSLSVRLL